MDSTPELAIGWILGAALVDSINPCVLGVLIFLIAFLNKIFRSPKRMLLGGFIYTAVVYATYLLLGLGIIKTATNFEVARTFYWAAAAIAIVAGLLEIKDYFWYGRGFSLQIVPGGAQRIKFYTEKLALVENRHPLIGLLSIGLLGIFVVLVELPCTGAPYFAILALIAEGYVAKALPYLLLYNFVFIAPLLIVIAFSYFGTSSETLENWRKQHRGLMRLGIGVFLLILGCYMVWSLQPGFLRF